MSIIGVCLGGLHRRLHERLQVKPSQTFVLGPASRVKPVLKPSAAYTGKVKPWNRGFTRLTHQSNKWSCFAKHFLKRLQLHQKSRSIWRARAGAVFGRAGALPNTPYDFVPGFEAWWISTQQSFIRCSHYSHVVSVAEKEHYYLEACSHFIRFY